MDLVLNGHEVFVMVSDCKFMLFTLQEWRMRDREERREGGGGLAQLLLCLLNSLRFWSDLEVMGHSLSTMQQT